MRNKSYTKKFKQKNYSNVIAGIPLIGLIILMLIMVYLFHDSPMIIAQILLFSIAVIFIATLIWLGITYKNKPGSLSLKKT